MDDCILQAKHLRYTYDAQERAALDDVSLEIRPGERIVLLGMNGAGKSTFFLCLNGVLEPQEGELLLRGERVTKKEQNLLRETVGIVFQNADDQIIASTVLAEISFGPMNLRLPREEVQRRVDDAIDYMALEPLRHRPPHYLSGGEKKRVTIADIVAMRSAVFLFDEPAASLDPVGVEMLEDVLRQLSQEGKTLLIATHDMDFAYRWAERAVVFANGKILADDTPLRVFQNEEVVKNAHLRRPVMLSVFESLQKRGLAPKEGYPRTAKELEELLDG